MDYPVLYNGEVLQAEQFELLINGDLNSKIYEFLSLGFDFNMKSTCFISFNQLFKSNGLAAEYTNVFYWDGIPKVFQAQAFSFY